MPGVEPGSENMTIRTPTFIAYLFPPKRISLLTNWKARLLKATLDMISLHHLKTNDTTILSF